ncbi:MAG: LytR C-terminal domain-containing protein [Thermoleophilia bacterium]|nr:LytR C-terminal domain-containing protein [Thermoleophilia bacterium]
MTMINVDTSPLQAAREWRGINLVSAALASGLPVAQAEALESGDPAAFDTIDEMIASAVVYGASLGIGRDEAMALLDRTVSGEGVQVELPAALDARPGHGFSAAVRERSARMTPVAETVQVEPLAPAPAMFITDDELDAIAGPDAPTGADAIEDVPFAMDTPAMPAHVSTVFPIVPSASACTPERGAGPVASEPFHGPSPEQAIAASAEIHMGHALEQAPWDRSGGDFTGELEAWAAEGDDDLAPARTRSGRGSAIAARVGAFGYGATERVLGSERADGIADAMNRGLGRLGDTVRAGREQMRRSEHATLVVAIGGGAVLIALVVAIGGALGGPDPVNPATVRTSPKLEAPGIAASATDATKSTTKKKTPVAVTAVLPPAKVHVNVFNAGSKKGYAKQVGDQLKAAKYQVGTVKNAGGKYAGATVIYPKTLEREARVLARRTGVTTLQVSPAPGATITLVVA